MTEQNDCQPPSSDAVLREALEWYAEKSRLCRLIHSEGDAGRKALADDGGSRARAALSSAPSPAAELPAFDRASELVARQLASFRLGLDADDPFAFTENEKLMAGHIVGSLWANNLLNTEGEEWVKVESEAALSSPAAGSDGWQRDAALEEAAKIAEGEYGQNAWKQNMAISDYIAKAIRTLKSAAPTPSTASGGE